ncbi:MAG: Ni/Fe-hydrogenase cytochrome b subunit [bacterium]|nr:Ni/Fe-hydrogenase cytochrome b subunit [bacterium]
MNQRLRIVKSILWALVGVWTVVSVGRFAHGLGPSTGLSNAAPWGLWIAFDVLGGVALAAGGFVLAAVVYIFGIERYRPLVRPAILTAFLGYVAVAVGLVYDLGLPWHIWHPMIYPQDHSVLFEVAMCVMLYLTVLALEFAPVVLEHPLFSHPFFRGVHTLLKKSTIWLVIAGIILSTLHQSSLGSLFLIVPYRLDPLWYTPIIYILFFISAVGLGLATLIMESLASGWLFGHRMRKDLLSRLGLAASVVLGLYVLVRLADLARHGLLARAFDGSWQANLFLFEMGIGFVLPCILLAVPRLRTSLPGLATGSFLVIFGVVLNRFTVSILAFAKPPGVTYFPTWPELAVSLGVVSGATLIFIFFVEHLKVYSEDDHAHPGEPGYIKPWRPSFDPATLHGLTPEWLAGPRRYSLVAIAGASLAVGLLPRGMLTKPEPLRTPVARARTVEAMQVDHGRGKRVEFRLVGSDAGAPAGVKTVPVMLIDGDRNGRIVFFPHDEIAEKLGGDTACAECHHLNLPFDRNTACAACHCDMYEEADIFNHATHIDHLNGNAGCGRCHDDPSRVKSRATATACVQCHADMIAVEPFLDKSQKETMTGLAPGYMNAMHDLCVACHELKVKENPNEYPASFAQCDFCHGESENIDLQRLGPYVALDKDGANGAATPGRNGID